MPAYSYVPRRFPHPIGDPAGHSFNQPPPVVETMDPARWRESEPLLYGVDLFNHGYYWEAHETWEALWRVATAARVNEWPANADFFKGLIKLAAAGVKAREGRPIGTRRHAARAIQLVRVTRQRLGDTVRNYWGLSLAALEATAAEIVERGAGDDPTAQMAVKIVLPARLELQT